MKIPPILLENISDKLSDKNWRLRNIYLILDENGETRPLILRKEQEQFLRERRNRNFVPKARKLGLSTIIVLDNADQCIWNADTRAGIIDLSENDAFEKLEIARFAWRRGPYHPDAAIAELWKWIHKAIELRRDAAGTMEWANGSVLSAGVNYTGKTPQRLHVSEYGPISARFPNKAARIKRGEMNSVPPTGIIDVETTIEGGEFGECNRLLETSLANEKLSDKSALDWHLQFFSWLHHPSYVIPGGKATKDETHRYFSELKDKHEIEVSDERQAFWEKKRHDLGDDVFTQFPSTVEELTRASVPGQIFPEMASVRAKGHVCDFEPEKGYPIFSCWDLGSSDNTAGWLVQPAGKFHNFLAWSAGEGAGAAGVAEVLRAWEERFGPIAAHLLPHDCELSDKGSGKTYLAQLVECGIPREKITVVPRIADLWVGIAEVRRILPNSFFHSDTDEKVETSTGTALPSGVQRIEGYRKKLDTSTGTPRDVPVHDVCSHTADAIRTYAEALSHDLVVANVERRRDPVQVMTGYRGTGAHRPRVTVATGFRGGL